VQSRNLQRRCDERWKGTSRRDKLTKMHRTTSGGRSCRSLSKAVLVLGVACSFLGTAYFMYVSPSGKDAAPVRWGIFASAESTSTNRQASGEANKVQGADHGELGGRDAGISQQSRTLMGRNVDEARARHEEQGASHHDRWTADHLKNQRPTSPSSHDAGRPSQQPEDAAGGSREHVAPVEPARHRDEELAATRHGQHPQHPQEPPTAGEGEEGKCASRGEEKRFLQEGEVNELGGKVALASFPRSGNSMTRGLLEEFSGIRSGSDFVDMSLAMAYNVMGEGRVDDSVWFIKTHWPNKPGPPIHISRAVVIVRNPLDVLVSWFNMMATNVHNYTLPDETFQTFSDLWENFVEHEVEMWSGFHDYWMAVDLPVLIVRYEDLAGPASMDVVEQIFSFTGRKGCEVYKKRGECAIKERASVYTPRKKRSSIEYFPPALLELVKVKARRWICLYGYGEKILGDKWQEECASISSTSKAFFAEAGEGRACDKEMAWDSSRINSSGMMLNEPDSNILRKYMARGAGAGQNGVKMPEASAPFLHQAMIRRGYRLPPPAFMHEDPDRFRPMPDMPTHQPPGAGAGAGHNMQHVRHGVHHMPEVRHDRPPSRWTRQHYDEHRPAARYREPLH